MRPEISASSPGSYRQNLPVPIAAARAEYIPYTARRRPLLQGRKTRPKSIAKTAALFHETPQYARAAPLLLPASRASTTAIHAPTRAAMSGIYHTLAYGLIPLVHAHGPVVVRCTAGR